MSMIHIGALISCVSAFTTPTPQDIISPQLKDITFRATFVKANHEELKKINKDFAEFYRFGFTDVWAEEPFKLRVWTKVKDTEIYYIVNGTDRVYKIPRLKMTKRENLAKAPGKRQTVLEFGIVTKTLITDLFDAKFVRIDRATEHYVFDLTYQSRFPDKSRQRIWVDPDKRYVSKREWYNQKGDQKATFFYEEPKQFNGVWFPTKQTVRNTDNKVAGVTEYSGVKVNTGLVNTLFEI